MLNDFSYSTRVGDRTGNGIYKGNWIFQTISNGKGNGNLEVSVKVIPVLFASFRTQGLGGRPVLPLPKPLNYRYLYRY